jgi:hypothetical protein
MEESEKQVSVSRVPLECRVRHGGREMNLATEFLRLSKLNDDIVINASLLKEAAIEFTKGARICITCGLEKNKSEFYVKPGPKLDSYCKQCRRERTKKNYRA